MAATWRTATTLDEPEIIRMVQVLYEEDPSVQPVPIAHTRKTLATLRAEPLRGRAVVLDVAGDVAGYAFLISFWSNELGGEVCVVDELFVAPSHRGQRHARALLAQLQSPSHLWPSEAVALELEVTPANHRAAQLYERAGFRPIKNTRLRLLLAK